jgi:hypothetical protein
MAHEIRTIFLTKDELVVAFCSYRRQNPAFLPAGKIINCTVESDKVMVDMTGEALVLLDASKLVEPLVRFCIESNIMLPKQSRKTVVFVDGQAGLHIEMDTYTAGGFEA